MGILVPVNTEALLVDALAQVGVQARAKSEAPDQGIDLVLDPGGIEVQVKHRALVTGEVARRLLRETPLPPDRVLLVVADRVTEDARAVLTGHHAGYFDLRGHLAMRSATIVIDVDVEPVSGRAERTSALNGTVGLEVATALLMNPADGAAVRELARRLGRSASTISEILAALRNAGLVDERHRVEGTKLFWQAAERWPTARVDLARLPMPGDATLTRSLRLGLDDAEQTVGWVGAHRLGRRSRIRRTAGSKHRATTRLLRPRPSNRPAGHHAPGDCPIAGSSPLRDPGRAGPCGLQPPA